MSFFSDPHLHDSYRWKNMRIGLLGGSFNPPHIGHVHISLAALHALKLDMVWWLVTPQNPLKSLSPLPFAERLKLSKEIAQHPRILVSDLEPQLGTNITYYTIKKLRQFFPDTDFVWVSGMDNAHSLSRWHHWQKLLKNICMLHLSRQPATSLIKASAVRMLQSQNHVFLNRAVRAPLDSGTTYWMMQKKMVNISSTEIRESNLNTKS